MKIRQLSYTACLSAVAFIGGSVLTFSFSGVKIAPVQHLVNLVTGVALGPWYGLAQAFISSCLRNIAGTGTLLAFPGSMIGALLVGMVYRQTQNLKLAAGGEVLGTGILGGCFSYGLAKTVLGLSVPFWLILSSFFVSALVGVLVGYPVVKVLQKRIPRLFRR